MKRLFKLLIPARMRRRPRNRFLSFYLDDFNTQVRTRQQDSVLI